MAITLPYKPTNVMHKFGGRVIEITGIRHQTSRPCDGYSRDVWWFVGRVLWDDTGLESESPIDQCRMCTDTPAGHKEINALSEVMVDYLRKHGEWFDGKPHQGWYANRMSKK